MFGLQLQCRRKVLIGLQMVSPNESYSGSSKSIEKKLDNFNDDTDYTDDDDDDDDDDDYDFDYNNLEPKEVVPESGKR